MNDNNNLQFSLFRGVHDTQPQAVTLDELVAMMRDDLSVSDLTEKHRYALSVGDKQSAKRYKDMMLSFSMAAQFLGGRRYEHITAHTNVSMSDMDDVAPALMAEALARIRADEHTLLAYTTMSGHGLRVLFRYEMEGMESIPVTKQGRELYKQAFEHGNAYYEALTGLPTDRQCKNTNRISTIAHDDNLYYNPDAVPFVIRPEEKKAVGRPRKVKSEKSRVKSDQLVEDVEAAVLAKVEAQGVRYEPGTYNAYVSRACYEMNRLGVSEEHCREWAVQHFDDYDTPEVEAIVRSCYQQTDEHGTATLSRSKAANAWASIREIQDWLTAKEIKIRHNVITRKREIMNENCYPLRPTGSSPLKRDSAHIAEYDTTNEQTKENCPSLRGTSETEQSVVERRGYQSSSLWKELVDKSVNSLYRAFSLDTGKRLRISDLYIIIESDFYPEYHPMREYLDGLPQWNGIDYIDLVASMVHVTGCAQEMHNRFFKKWLVAMVAAWLEPDKTNHEILTYIGPQGIYKSTFMYHLLPTELRAYFSTKNFAGRMTKDDRLELTEMALVSLEELDSLQSAELNQLKAITTDPTVNERAAFARYKERRPHIASFCGTGNNPRFLTDLTDNRRWLPFLVKGIDSPWSHPLPYTGMYAQAYTLYRTGFRYWFDEVENAELKRHNRQFEEPCMEEELILTYLRRPEGDEPGEFLTATRIVELIGQYVRTRLSPKKVALSMNRLGFEQRRTHSARGWIAVTLNGDEIKAAQRMNVHRSRKDE